MEPPKHSLISCLSQRIPKDPYLHVTPSPLLQYIIGGFFIPNLDQYSFFHQIDQVTPQSLGGTIRAKFLVGPIRDATLLHQVVESHLLALIEH
jgi:hypothetical protein